MSRNNIIDEMTKYYHVRAHWHDIYMDYTTNAQMETLLAPLIDYFQRYIRDRDLLEIACGTGNWTQVLVRQAHSVLATDVNDSMIAIARKKHYQNDSVTFKVADAYTLDEVEGPFTAAFAGDWWSHMPKSKIVPFLRALHRKLCRGAQVVFVDMMYRDDPNFMPYRCDAEGNLIHKRRLPNGQEFDVVKNFPTKQELFRYLEGMAEEIEFREFPVLLRWMLAYRTR